MNHLRRTLITLAVAAAVPASVAAAPSDSFDGWSAGIGPEVAHFDREGTLEIGGAETDFDGDGYLFGLQGHVRRGAHFLGEVRLLTGDLDNDIDALSGESSDDTTFGEVRATIGSEIVNNGRLYSGIGHEIYEADSDFADLEWDTSSTYIPLGYTTTAKLSNGWVAETTFEGRFIITGDEKVDNVDNIPGFATDSVSLSHSEGFGATFSIKFRDPRSGVAIEPFFATASPGDADGSQGVEYTGIENNAFGVRLSLPF